VTSVSPFEEFFIETFIMGGKAQDRKIGRQLRRRGYDYDSALPKGDYAVRDCNLVTSQNPFSGPSFLREFRSALVDARAGIACTGG
jgi:putative intracellular protease/amidase